MSFNRTVLAAAVFAALTGAAVAAPYHPGYSDSEIRLRAQEARAANAQVTGTHGAALATAPAVSGVYHPGYSDSDVIRAEREPAPPTPR
ncbi:hypothetical protein [Methylobrevis pamukkalensis]|uniref:DUF4148 domain-containing protein n=1 Tax=Methylobrevis pamukkalensis TaxID=1439726 RepID=A0A1E3GXT4_9HYPH|nr:hypothetical protein [Methylobrevis pamukkalensis]ODN68735.1 hypothetical protein A6302_03967 [Methylobrevis pamukkalensis]